MRTVAEIVASVAGDGTTRLRKLSGGGPLTLRPTGLPGRCRVHLVAGMFGLLGGDELELRVVLETGARLHVQAVAATLVLPSRDREVSSMHLRLEIAQSARLTMMLPPTLICAAAEHTMTTDAAIAADGELLLRESIVRGRSGEAGGDVTQRSRLDVAGTPLLRQSIVLAGASAWPWNPRAFGTMLHISPDAKPTQAVAGESTTAAAWLALPRAAGHQFAALADDPLALSVMLDEAQRQLPRYVV